MSAPTVTSIPPTSQRLKWLLHWPGCAFLLFLPLIWLSFASSSREATNWQRSTHELDSLQLDSSDDLIIDTKSGRVETGTDTSEVKWHGEKMEGLQFLQLQILCETQIDWRSCLLQFFALNDPELYFDADLIHHRTRRPRLQYQNDGVTISWLLPRPVQSLKLILPKSAHFQIEQITWAGQSKLQYESDAWIFAGKIIVLGVELGLLLLWFIRFTPSLGSFLASGRIVSLVSITVMGILMIWLLPPFQGPDENRHWKAAVRKFRTDGQPGYILHDLPDLLEAESPRWRAENAFHSDTFFSVPYRPFPAVEKENVGYAGPWAYPFVGVVSLCFPAVHSLSEALTFYYLCRILPLICVCLLLALIQKQHGVSWLLTIFLSLPLVQQQCIIVSTDLLPNLGTLAALLLFARMRFKPSWWTWSVLWIITVGVIMAKPPIYLILLSLPGWFLPWRHLLRGWRLSALIIVMIAGSWVGNYFLWNIVEKADHDLAQRARQQLQFVGTPEGFSTFLAGASEYPYRACNPLTWCAPLGWLDTDLNENHLILLELSLALALLLDLVRFFRKPGREYTQWFLSMFFSLALIGFYFLFTWLSLALVMYLTITPYQDNGIYGMQVRYLFPVILFSLVFPRILIQRIIDRNGSVPPGRMKSTLLHFGQVLMVVIFIARLIQLAIDLQYRYW